MDMDISMDIHEKSVDMDMDMDAIFHIHGNPENLCGRDGRTICGPERVRKSAYVSL